MIAYELGYLLSNLKRHGYYLFSSVIWIGDILSIIQTWKIHADFCHRLKDDHKLLGKPQKYEKEFYFKIIIK